MGSIGVRTREHSKLLPSSAWTRIVPLHGDIYSNSKHHADVYNGLTKCVAILFDDTEPC